MKNEEFKQTLINRSYSFSLSIIRFTSQLNQRDYVLQVIIRQLIRCSTSVGANIVEAQAASSKKDFVNFLNHALKSANECSYWLSLLRDSDKIGDKKMDFYLKEADELAKILGASVRTLRK